MTLLCLEKLESTLQANDFAEFDATLEPERADDANSPWQPPLMQKSIEERMAGLRRAQERCRPLIVEGHSVVEEFLRERREEALREGYQRNLPASRRSSVTQH